MTVKDSEPSKELLSGIRALAGIQCCEVLEKPLFFTEKQAWLLRVRLSIEDDSNFIPITTTWCVLIHEAYPLGTIEIYPSKIGGIKATFPHQQRNEEGKEDVPWRTGKICTDSPIRNLNFLWQNTDPIGDADTRLRVHIERALAWLYAAVRNNLVKDGDPFELPQYPRLTLPLKVVHDEGPEFYATWLSNNSRIGEVIFNIFFDGKTLIAIEFKDLKGNFIRRASFLLGVNTEHERKGKKVGIWWRWDSPIVLDPWEVPATWKELRQIGKKLGVNVDNGLEIIARRIREKQEQILLIGYPIPLRKGDVNCEIHWYSILIPQLKKFAKPRNGFRNNEKGWWYHDRTTVFSDNEKINYILTHNWHSDRLQARGRMVQTLREMRILIIGVGALGSAIAEFLVRGGTKNIMIMDNDELMAGNLVRHILTFRDLDVNKAKALREHLVVVNPSVNIVADDRQFPNTKKEVEELLEGINLVIDCTASDEVLESLSLGWWPIPKIFVSLSLGFKGRRLFIFINDEHSFSAMEFKKRLHPWIHKEATVMYEQGETLEGPGCWSPLFPARYDDIMLASASAIKVIEEVIEKRPVATQFIVYEQENDNNSFKGFRRIS
ncbi:MAG: ThiF family adenylyltransferase [Candidatus Jettenia sp.]|nr:MAG: ThiF family adenylyltransferase [Candidatus Jettenia sp.]